MYAALSRHLDYELRIHYGDAYYHPILLAETDLVDHTKLREQFQSTQPQNKRLSSLLSFARFTGVPLWNNRTYRIPNFKSIPLAQPKDDDLEDITPHWEKVYHLSKWLEDGTVLGTMAIKSDYTESLRDQTVYKGTGELETSTHSVVILGLRALDPHQAARYGCEPGTYVIYQDMAAGPNYEGFFGTGRNMAPLGIFLKIYQVKVSIPNELRGRA
ncbi:unnamed protein product [Cuscuta campestris]|uniref:Uncharacterized protein n=1 Tax=Cuscuta campestris TaxID=132261 RepID=A0A484KBS1_9ASTE|nr:unnamed protein product [Cuscuta campestris]